MDRYTIADSPRPKYQGPEYGEHDSHWYIRRGRDRLHMVDGYAWHDGLPLEKTLLQVENISVRSWTFGENVVLDLSGRTTAGKYWRWLGAPVAGVIEYAVSQRSSVDYFDRIINSLCFWSSQARR